MKCSFCGTEMPDDSAFCPECGRSVKDTSETVIDSGESVNTGSEQTVINTVNTYEPSQVINSESDNVVVDPQKDKTMAIVGYITWIGFIIAMVSDSKNSTFTKFHLNQSLILNIASLVCTFIPVVGGILALVVFVFWIMAIVSAVNGEMKSLPLIENVKIIK